MKTILIIVVITLISSNFAFASSSVKEQLDSLAKSIEVSTITAESIKSIDHDIKAIMSKSLKKLPESEIARAYCSVALFYITLSEKTTDNVIISILYNKVADWYFAAYGNRDTDAPGRSAHALSDRYRALARELSEANHN